MKRKDLKRSKFSYKRKPKPKKESYRMQALRETLAEMKRKKPELFKEGTNV